MTRKLISTDYLSSIEGKLIIFLSIALFGIIITDTYLSKKSNDIKINATQLENTRIPVSINLNRLNEELLYSISISQNALDGKGSLKVDYSTFNNSVFKKELFSFDSYPLIDSIKGALTRIENESIAINAAAYSIALSQNIATLPGLKSDILKKVSELKIQIKSTSEQVERLRMDNDAQIKEELNVIKKIADTTLFTSLLGGVGIVALIIASGAIFLVSFKKSLAIPIASLNKLVEGEASEAATPTQDEFGSIIQAVNKLSINLTLASTFAHRIGEGNINHNFQPVSNLDLLGNSLVQMRDNLRTINDDDKKRNWIAEGLGKFANIMRKNDDYASLSDTLISELVKYTLSSLGGMFIVQEDQNRTALQLTACYAYERKKFLKKNVEAGEGLVGQCFLERRTIVLNKIPADYLTITSGLGGANPKALLLVPLKVNDDIEGVIELASFNTYQKHEIEFIERVGEIIAATISNARTNERTKDLLKESQQQGEQLGAQEEEMRQNMEEMLATQEQMQRQANEMRSVQKTLELEKSMLHILMEYLSDRITFKDRQSKVLRINKAKADRFNIKPEEMIGKSDYDYFAKEHADKAFAEEQEMLRTGKALLNVEERAALRDGSVAWGSVSRIPFHNDNMEVIGMFIITKDITNLKIAESSIQDHKNIIDHLLEDKPVFRYKIDRNGMLTSLSKTKVLGSFDDQKFESRLVKDCFANVHAIVLNKKSDVSGYIGNVLESDGEEIFKHYIFTDSTYDNVYFGFAIKQ